MLNDALDQLLGACAADDSLRDDIPTDDVLINLSGIAVAGGQESQRPQAERLLDLLMDALHYRTPTN
jgi:hypothetical protein